MSELTPDEKQKIFYDEKIRRESKEALAKAIKHIKNKKRNIVLRCLVFAIVVIVIFVALSRLPPRKGSNQKPLLSAQHESEIQTALQGKGFPAPKSLEIIESGWLAITFELPDPKSAKYLESFATDTLLTIRNAMYPHSFVSKYRVTLEGPPPGPGLVLLYGSARFIEGGTVEWEPAKK